jgi:hypothetical protein
MTTIQPKPCRRCGELFIQQGRGRPRSFCTDDCRIRHHRERRKPSGKQPRHSPRLPGFPPVTKVSLPSTTEEPVVVTAPNRQVPLFPVVRDLSRYDAELHAEPGNAVLAAAAHRLAGIAEERGWSAEVERMTRQGLLTVLSSRVEGEPVPRTEVNQLPALKFPAVRVAEVLAELGLLIEDQQPAIRQWIDRRADELPAGFRDDVRDWLIWLHEGDKRTRPRSDATLYCYLGNARPVLEGMADTRRRLREITTADLQAAIDRLTGRPRGNTLVALKSLFRFAVKYRRVFKNPAARMHTGKAQLAAIVPLEQATIDNAVTVATTPRLRLIVALAAVHGARPGTIRNLRLDDVDLGNRRIIIDTAPRTLDDLTRHALLDYLAERRTCWPHTSNPHLLVSRVTAGGTEPVSTFFLKQDLLVRHGVRLDDIRADRVLEEALHRGPDALHLTVVFGFNEHTGMRYAELARRILQGDQPVPDEPDVERGDVVQGLADLLSRTAWTRRGPRGQLPTAGSLHGIAHP